MSAKEKVAMAVGEVLFTEGEPGGDLYFIEEGEVEIFRTTSSGEIVVLDVVKPKQVLGTATCLTMAPRTASARVSAPLIALRVSHPQLKKLIGTLPSWFSLIVKDMAERLAMMNQKYGEATQVKTGAKAEVSQLYTGIQFAAACATLAELVAVTIDEERWVFIEKLVAKVAAVLAKTEEDVEELFNLFLNAGLFKVEIEPEKKARVTRLENMRVIGGFPQFAQSANQGLKRKMVQYKFRDRELRILEGLVKYVKSKDLPTKTMVRVPIPELIERMPKTVGQMFEVDALQPGLKFELIRMEGAADKGTVVFHPSSLGCTLSYLAAYKALVVRDLERL